MVWFRVVQYVVVFPTIFALLGSSRHLGRGVNNQYFLQHEKNSLTSNHDKLNVGTKLILTAKSANVKGSIMSKDNINVNSSRNAKIGATIALVLLIFQVSHIHTLMYNLIAGSILPS